MDHYFKNILVPVDFTSNTEVAVKKAIELAETNSAIRLLYVNKNQTIGFFNPVYEVVADIPGSHDPAVEEKLHQWQRSISETLPYATVSAEIIKRDSVQHGIAQNAMNMSADLIIIGKSSHHSWLPFLNTVIPSELAKESGSAVLTVKSGGISNKTRTMVVPVTNDNAIHKLAMINAIYRKFHVKIYLATFADTEERQPKFCTKAFLQLYQVLKGSKYQVNYTVLSSNNKTKAILKYAEKLNADILLVDHDNETRIGWPNKHISDIIPEHSKLQVWAV
jgi:nucleotide-binding universal stress UspA family protein